MFIVPLLLQVEFVDVIDAIENPFGVSKLTEPNEVQRPLSVTITLKTPDGKFSKV